MAVSINRVLFVGVLTMNALLLGVSVRAPDCWKLPPEIYERLTAAEGSKALVRSLCFCRGCVFGTNGL